MFIEAAKTALKNNPKKLETILDSQTRGLLDIMEDDFIDTDLGVFVTDSRKAHEYKKTLEQSAQAFMQNGGDFSFVFDVLFSDSMQEKRRLIEDQEEKARAANEQARADQNAQFQSQVEAEERQKEKDREFKKYEVDLEASIKLKLKAMDADIKGVEINSDERTSLEKIKADILKVEADMSASNEQNKVKREEIKSKSASQTAPK